jgi:outer membrane autotransporter protein
MCADLFALDASDAPLTADQRDLLVRCDGLLFGNSAGNQIDALDELVSDDFAVARTQTLLFAKTQFISVMDRLIALRGGARGLSLAGLNVIVDGKLVPLAQLQEMAKELFGGGASADEPGGLLSDKWGLWARGNYSFGEKARTASAPSFDADQWALVGGVDYRLSDNAVLGVSLAYGESSVEFEPGSEGALDTRSWAFSLYGSAYAARNFYLDGIVNVANAGYDAQRNITYVDGSGLISADAQGDTDGNTYSAGLSAGYDFLVGGLTLSPTLGVFYIDATIDGFAESGAGGLSLVYDEQKFKSTTGNAGLRATYAWNLSWGVLLPQVRADFVREFENDVDVFGVRFAADPNATSAPPILVETDNPDASYWRFAAGFSAQFKYGLSGYVEYQRLESFDFIRFQDVSVGLRLQRSF